MVIRPNIKSYGMNENTYCRLDTNGKVWVVDKLKEIAF
jgi:hypothetical protein